MNGMEYIRRSYGVPARRGGRIKYMGKKTGIILSSRYGRLRVRFDGEKKTSILRLFVKTCGIDDCMLTC